MVFTIRNNMKGYTLDELNKMEGSSRGVSLEELNQMDDPLDGFANAEKIKLGQKVLNAGTSVANFFGAKGISETFGAEIAKVGKSQEEKNTISANQPKLKETVGSALQFGANFLPGAGVGAGLANKAAVGAGTGLAFDVGSGLQKGESVGEALKPGVGTAIGAGLPVLGAVIKPAVRIVGRLFKGLGSGLSGVSTETIDKIVNNPKVAQQASEKLAKAGNSKVLEENARTILNGVSKVRQEARKAFGEGLDQLASTDIKPDVFRANTQKVLDKYGSQLEGGKRLLSKIEFDDPKNIKKASELIDELSNVELNGKSIRKLADDIESSAFKVATSDERLSFNAFIKDLSSSLKSSVSASTDKLNNINKAFSKDMQLAEAVEGIFGKVNFKNLSEVVKASQRLETVFAQKGLAPDVVDDFLTRIGISAKDFKTTEAVRQISNKAQRANEPGLSIGELVRGVTSAVITPQMVKTLSIASGLTAEKLVPLLKSLAPTARNILIQALLKTDRQGSGQNQ